MITQPDRQEQKPSQDGLRVLTTVILGLVPLAGVVFFRWTVINIIFLFWAETLILAFLLGIRALRDRAIRTLQDLAQAGILVFVVLIFSAAQLLFLFLAAIFTGELHGRAAVRGFLSVGNPMLLAALAACFIQSLFGSGLIRNPDNPDPGMPAIIPRLLIQQFVIIVAFGLGMLKLASSPVPVGLLCVMKVWIDLAAGRPKRSRTVT